MANISCDILIIGAGIAGLRAALEVPENVQVVVLSKSPLGESATGLAQGGIAAAIQSPADSPLYHFHDTLTAGAGLCDEKAVEILVHEGVDRVRELIALGAQFDRARSATGFELAMEGAHRQRRILHVGDATGKEILRALELHARSKKNINLLTDVFVSRLLTAEGSCHGASITQENNSAEEIIQSKATILCSGGLGQVYLFTTNPPSATGDGVAIAYRAGATVSDMEFIQFHPTALVHTEKLRELVAIPQFLISEAVRGEGGILVNTRGVRFMEKYHPEKELAPRDVVSRAIFQEMKETESSHVLLSLEKIPADLIHKRFPNIARICKERGLDITREAIPVAPAAHYAMGGVETDVFGRTNIPGLYAAGEVAACGVHGANRLASNSLLDGLVYGYRAVHTALEYIASHHRVPPRASEHDPLAKPSISPADISHYRERIRRLMWEEVGIVRNGKGLEKALKLLSEWRNDLRNLGGTREVDELQNLRLVAELITRAALERTESRGAHFRSDHPEIDPTWGRHLTYRAG